jgi:hypothetical protein
MGKEFEDEHERGWVEGNRAAYRSVLGECLRHLDGKDRDAHRWQAERADVVAVLRRVCAEYGDNEWPDDLHLGDVIEKHLEPYLEAARPRMEE